MAPLFLPFFVMQSGEKIISFLAAWKGFIEVQIESVPERVVEQGQKLSARENALAQLYHSSNKLMFFIETGQRHSNRERKSKRERETGRERCIKDDLRGNTLTCTSTTRHTMGCFQTNWGQMRLYSPSNRYWAVCFCQNKIWLYLDYEHTGLQPELGLHYCFIPMSL